MPNAVNDIHKQASAIIRAKMNNSDDIPPMPPLDDFSFALDIDEGPPFGDNTVNSMTYLSSFPTMHFALTNTTKFRFYILLLHNKR